MKIDNAVTGQKELKELSNEELAREVLRVLRVRADNLFQSLLRSEEGRKRFPRPELPLEDNSATRAGD